MWEYFKVAWIFIKLILEFICGICESLYENYGVGFIIAAVLVIITCIFCVFGGLIDNYEEYRKQRNYKNLVEIAKKLNKH